MAQGVAKAEDESADQTVIQSFKGRPEWIKQAQDHLAKLPAK
jgi:hypothetical protein